MVEENVGNPITPSSLLIISLVGIIRGIILNEQAGEIVPAAATAVTVPWPVPVTIKLVENGSTKAN